MARGPAPTPIESRLRSGNDPSHRPQRMPVVIGGRSEPGGPLPPAPPSLSIEAKRVWRQYVRLLIDGGIYDQADGVAVETAAGLTVRLRQCRQALDDLAAGRVTVNTGRGQQRASSALDVFVAPSVRGIVRNPVAAQEVELSNALRMALAEIGLSPAGRTRLGRKEPNRKTLGAMREGLAAGVRAGGA